MKFDVQALALASGTMAALIFSLCTLFVALAPEATVWATRELFHVAIASPPIVTWSGIGAGLVVWFGGTTAVAAALASLYNRWARA